MPVESPNLFEDLLFGENLVSSEPILEAPILKSPSFSNLPNLIVSRFSYEESGGRMIDKNEVLAARTIISEFRSNNENDFMRMAIAIKMAAMCNPMDGDHDNTLSSLSGNTMSNFSSQFNLGNQSSFLNEHQTGKHEHCSSCSKDKDKCTCKK